MTEATKPFWACLGRHVGLLGDDIRESIALRWRLAVLEIKADLLASRRLAVALLAAAVAVLTALPLLLAALAFALDGRLGLSTGVWMLLFGAALLAIAPAAGYLAWRRFRAHLTGLEQTLEELREDAAWLQEWLHKP